MCASPQHAGLPLIDSAATATVPGRSAMIALVRMQKPGTDTYTLDGVYRRKLRVIHCRYPCPRRPAVRRSQSGNLKGAVDSKPVLGGLESHAARFPAAVAADAGSL